MIAGALFILAMGQLGGALALCLDASHAPSGPAYMLRVVLAAWLLLGGIGSGVCALGRPT